MGDLSDWITALQRSSPLQNRARYESTRATATADPAAAARLSLGNVGLALAEAESKKRTNARDRALLGCALLAAEALRRQRRPWPAAWDLLLGGAASQVPVDGPHGRALAAQLDALPAERRERACSYAVALSSFGDGWFLRCPSPATLLALARRAETPTGSVHALHSALARVDEPTALWAGAIEILLESEPSMRRGAATLLAAAPLLAPGSAAWAAEPERLEPLFVDAFHQAMAAPHDPVDDRPGRELSGLQAAFAALPLPLREQIALSVALSGAAGLGPHVVAPTAAVAARAADALFDGDAVAGSTTLGRLPPALVDGALAARVGASVALDGWLAALRWTLPRGWAPGVGGDAERVPLARIARVELVSAAPVMDLMPTPAGIYASAADGTLCLLTPPGRQDLRSGSRLAPCRIAAVTERDVLLWGWEEMIWVSRETGEIVWQLELGHALDEDGGDCCRYGRWLMLPNNWVMDLETRELFWSDAVERLEDAGPAAADAEGFLIATGDRLLRWRPGAAVQEIAAFDGHIMAIAATEPTAVVLDGGRLVSLGAPPPARPREPFTLAARETDGRAHYYPAWPVQAQLQRLGDLSVLAANDRDPLSGSCLSGVVAWRGDERVFVSERRGGLIAPAFGAGFVAAPGELLVPGDEGLIARSIPGLRPSAACVSEGAFVIGCVSGLVVFVEACG